MDAKELLENAGADEDWTPGTMMTVACDFINEQGLAEEFRDYLAARIEEEHSFTLDAPEEA